MLFHTYLNVLVRNAKRRVGYKAKILKVEKLVKPVPVENGTKSVQVEDDLSAWARLVGMLLGDKKIDEARFFNRLAQNIFVLLVFIFMIVFWSIALAEYLRDPKSFLKGQLF